MVSVAVLEAYRWTPRSCPRSLVSPADSVAVVVAAFLEVAFPSLKAAVASVVSLAVSAERRAGSISLDKETVTRTTAARQLPTSPSGAAATRPTTGKRRRRKRNKRRMTADLKETRPRIGVYMLKPLPRHATVNYSSFAILAW